MEEMTRLFNLDAQLLHDAILMALAVFFLFMFLSKMLFNPVRKMLEDRREKIAGDIDAAESDKNDAAALKAEYESKIRDIDKEAEQILSEARRKAQSNASRIEDEARGEAARIIQRANEEAELSRKRAMDEAGNDHDCVHDGGKSGRSEHQCNDTGDARRRNIERNG